MPAASKNRTSPRGQGSSASSGSRSHPYQPGPARRGQPSTSSSNHANRGDEDTTKEAQEIFWRERSGTSESSGTGAAGAAGAGGKRHLSCENCRMRKMRCSRQSPCLSCRMRGDECVWVGTPPGGVAEEDELKSTNDEIERLKKLVDLLLERLEEQNEAEEQQQQQARLAGSTVGGDAGYPNVGGLPSMSGASNPYQAHFALAQPQQQHQAPHVYGAESTSDIRVYSPHEANPGGGGANVGRSSFAGSSNGFPAHLMSAAPGSTAERMGSAGNRELRFEDLGGGQARDQR